MQKLLFLCLAGAAGTLARYGLSGLLQRTVGTGFPWGTFAVNALGCFAAGFAWTFFSSRVSIDPTVRIVVLIGFMGAFTTFSSLMLETGQMVRDAEWIRAASNVALHNVIGFICVIAGLSAGRMV